MFFRYLLFGRATMKGPISMRAIEERPSNDSEAKYSLSIKRQAPASFQSFLSGMSCQIGLVLSDPAAAVVSAAWQILPDFHYHLWGAK